MTQAILLGFDIGATSVKVGAFDHQGQLIAIASEANAPQKQAGGSPEWRIWDVEEIWAKLCQCSKQVISKLDSTHEIKGVATSGFGVDGVPVTSSGEILYPCISWHCTRTVPQAQQLQETGWSERIYNTAGYHIYPICTLNRLLWMKENAPEAIENMAHFLHVQDYIAYKLSSEFSTESTIASTTLFLDVKQRTWADSILNDLGLSSNSLSPLYESGTPIGKVTQAASEETGIPVGVTVSTGGHDTELAILGAGVKDKNTYLDINGTWEILMAITDSCDLKPEQASQGLDWECHAIPGWWNIQALMLAGGVIDWIRTQFYRDNDKYELMIQEAIDSPLGSNNVFIHPSFVRGMGPAQGYDPLGTIVGITTQTSRGDIARAMFESLSYQFYQQIEAIEKCLGTTAETIQVTGGGQKNPFWMQMKADVSGRTLNVLQNVESTLLGAAMLAGIGSGIYQSPQEAMNSVNIPTETVEPDLSKHEQYKERFDNVVSSIPQTMQPMFRAIHQLD